MLNIKKTADNLRLKVKEANQDFFKVSNEIVEDTIATGEQWQHVFGDALKTGTHALNTQQKLALKAVAGMREQYMEGSQRFMQLIGIDAEELTNKVKESADEAKARVNKATSVAKTRANKMIEKTTTEARQAVARANAATDNKGKMSSKINKMEKSMKAEVAEVVAETNEVVEKVAKAVKPTVQRDNLKLINRVGPKMEEVLNKYGVQTFADLANVNAKVLSNQLEMESARYAGYDVEEWKKEAKKLAK